MSTAIQGRLPPLEAQPDASELALAELGNRVRQLRLLRGLKLGDVALRSGLSKSLLSMLERGKANCTIGTLVSVANTLRVPITDLFHPEGDASGPVTPRARQRVMAGREGTRRVLVLDPARRLEFSENTYLPGAESATRPLSHGGWECGVVVEGELELELDGEAYRLSSGDSFAFHSVLPHRFRNAADRPALVHWINVYEDVPTGG